MFSSFSIGVAGLYLADSTFASTLSVSIALTVSSNRRFRSPTSASRSARSADKAFIESVTRLATSVSIDVRYFLPSSSCLKSIAASASATLAWLLITSNWLRAYSRSAYLAAGSASILLIVSLITVRISLVSRLRSLMASARTSIGESVWATSTPAGSDIGVVVPAISVMLRLGGWSAVSTRALYLFSDSLSCSLKSVTRTMPSDEKYSPVATASLTRFASWVC